MLDNQTQHAKPKAIVVTGGLAKSTYIMKKIREKYEEQGIFVARLWEYASAEYDLLASIIFLTCH